MHASLLVGFGEPEWEGYQRDQAVWTLELVHRPVTTPLTVMLWASEAACPRMIAGAILTPYDSRLLHPCTATTGTQLAVRWELPRVLEEDRDTVTVVVPRQVGTVRFVRQGKEWGSWSPYAATNPNDRPMSRVVVGDTVRRPCRAVVLPLPGSGRSRPAPRGRKPAPPVVADTVEVPCAVGQAPGSVRLMMR